MKGKIPHKLRAVTEAHMLAECWKTQKKLSFQTGTGLHIEGHSLTQTDAIFLLSSYTCSPFGKPSGNLSLSLMKIQETASLFSFISFTY
jgi:hypothetical protein